MLKEITRIQEIKKKYIIKEDGTELLITMSSNVKNYTNYLDQVSDEDIKNYEAINEINRAQLVKQEAEKNQKK